MRLPRILFTVALIAALFALPASAQGNGKEKPDPVGAISGSGFELTWHPTVEHERLVLNVIAPDGSSFSKEFNKGKAPVFQIGDIPGGAIDGQYTYELRVIPFVPPGVLKQLTEARNRGNQNEVLRLRFLAGLDDTLVQSGGFTVLNGSFLDPNATEPAGGSQISIMGSGTSNAGRGRPAGRTMTTEELVEALTEVIPQDLIVQGSLCVGIDCASSESFGFDTIRLKENNTRIKFEDTSSTGSFPTTDWQLTANDSANGGTSKFSIEDITSARAPFTVEGGASTNSIYVDDIGRVGFRTATPVLDLHVTTSNTPGLRLEQTNAGGFTSQTWDVAGNEANFFIRSVTTGSQLPFRIRPGAPTSSIDIASSGNVGIGTTSPDAPLDIERSGGAATFETLLLLNRTSGGPPGMLFLDGGNNNGWQFRMTSGGNFRLTDTNGAGVDDVTTEFDLTRDGNLFLSGSVNPTSSRYMKADFADIDSRAILDKVSSLWISTWRYKHQGPDDRHLGPVAEDFYEAFGVGTDAEHLSPSDTAGVALAAIQGLHALLREKEQEIEELQKRLDELSTVVATLTKQD